MAKTKDQFLEDIISGRTSSTRLLDGVCRAVTAEEGKIASYTETEAGNGWREVKFYWKPKVDSPPISAAFSGSITPHKEEA